MKRPVECLTFYWNFRDLWPAFCTCWSAVGFNLLKNRQFLWTENFESKLLAFYNGSMKIETLSMWNGKKLFTTCSYHIGCYVTDFFSGDILLPIFCRWACHECFKPLPKIINSLELKSLCITSWLSTIWATLIESPIPTVPLIDTCAAAK